MSDELIPPNDVSCPICRVGPGVMCRKPASETEAKHPCAARIRMSSQLRTYPKAVEP